MFEPYILETFEDGSVVEDALNKARKAVVTDLPLEDQAIGGVETDEDIDTRVLVANNAGDLSWMDATGLGGAGDIEVCVPDDYATLQEAFDDLGQRSNRYVRIILGPADPTALASFKLTEGLHLKGGDFSKFLIEQRDFGEEILQKVEVGKDPVTNIHVEKDVPDGHANFQADKANSITIHEDFIGDIFLFENTNAPQIRARFNAEFAPNCARGFCYFKTSTGYIHPRSGVYNLVHYQNTNGLLLKQKIDGVITDVDRTNPNKLLWDNDKIDLRGVGLFVWTGSRVYGDKCYYYNNAMRNIHVSSTSTASLAFCNIMRSGGEGVFISRASIVQLDGSYIGYSGRRIQLYDIHGTPHGSIRNSSDPCNGVQVSRSRVSFVTSPADAVGKATYKECVFHQRTVDGYPFSVDAEYLPGTAPRPYTVADYTLPVEPDAEIEGVDYETFGWNAAAGHPFIEFNLGHGIFVHSSSHFFGGNRSKEWHYYRHNGRHNTPAPAEGEPPHPETYLNNRGVGIYVNKTSFANVALAKFIDNIGCGVFCTNGSIVDANGAHIKGSMRISGLVVSNGQVSFRGGVISNNKSVFDVDGVSYTPNKAIDVNESSIVNAPYVKIDGAYIGVEAANNSSVNLGSTGNMLGVADIRNCETLAIYAYRNSRIVADRAYIHCKANATNVVVSYLGSEICLDGARLTADGTTTTCCNVRYGSKVVLDNTPDSTTQMIFGAGTGYNRLSIADGSTAYVRHSTENLAWYSDVNPNNGVNEPNVLSKHGVIFAT